MSDKTSMYIKESYELLLKLFWKEYFTAFIFSDIYLSLLTDPEMEVIKHQYNEEDINTEIDIYGKTKNYSYAIEVSYRKTIEDVKNINDYVDRKINNLLNNVNHIYFVFLCNTKDTFLETINRLKKYSNIENVSFLIFLFNFDEKYLEISLVNYEIITSSEFSKNFLMERVRFIKNRLDYIKSIDLIGEIEFLISPITSREIIRQYKILFTFSFQILLFLREIIIKRELYYKNLIELKEELFKKIKNKIIGTLLEYLNKKIKDVSHIQNEKFIINKEQELEKNRDIWFEIYEKCIELFVVNFLNLNNKLEPISERRIINAIKIFYEILKELEKIKVEKGIITKHDIETLVRALARKKQLTLDEC